MASKKPVSPQDSDDIGTKPNDVLKKTLDRFRASWQYAQSSYHTQWDEAWKLYNNRRVHYNYKGTANTFVPMTFGAIETMVAALANGRPSFDYEPEYPGQNQDTDVLNTLVDNYADRDQWDVKFTEIIRQMLITGNAPAYVYWENDHPRLLHFSIRDAIIDPNLVSPMQLLNGEGYAGRRYLTTIDALKEYEVVDSDPKSKTYGEMKPRFQNLDNIKDKGSNGADKTTDKERKDMFMGTTAEQPDEHQVEIIEVWDEDRCISIANRTTVIEDIVNPTKQIQIDRGDPNPKGIIPFVFFRDYTDVSLFYGKGEIEPIKHHQEMLNDITNQNLDAVTLQLSPQIELDPAFASWINKIDNTPGRVYPFKPGTIGWRQPPQIAANAFNERTNIKQEIREATAIDQIAKGVSDTGSQEQTATAVRAQLNNAGQRIELKALMLEKDGFYQLGVILFRLIQLYVDDKILVKVASSTGVDLRVFDPKQFIGNYHPRVQLDLTTKQQEQDRQQKAIQAFQAIIQDPTNNLAAAKKILYPKMFDLEQKEIDEIITPDPQQQAAMAAQQQQEQQPQEEPQTPQEKIVDQLQIKFSDLPEDVKAQLIQHVFGITPTMASPVQQQIELKQADQAHNGVVADNSTKMQVAQMLVQQQQQAQQAAQQAQAQPQGAGE